MLLSVLDVHQYLVDCDEVVFMKEGCITERGSHEDLMNLNGDYAAIFNNLQLGETPHIEVSCQLAAAMGLFSPFPCGILVL